MIIVTTTTTKTKPQVGTSTLRTADTIRHIAIAAAHDAKPAVIAGVVRSHARGGRALVFAQVRIRRGGDQRRQWKQYIDMIQQHALRPRLGAGPP